MPRFEAKSDFDFPVEDLFDYHARPGAIDRLLPPWQNVSVVQKSSSIEVGAVVVLRLGTPLGIPVRWYAKHTKLDRPSLFEDIQVKGPMRAWTHEHRFESISESASRLSDLIDYQLPGGSIGEFLGGGFIASDLKRMFRYRHATTGDDIHLIRRFPQRPLRIAVSGGNGLVGSHLIALLQVAGHTVYKLTRNNSKSTTANATQQSLNSLAWSPTTGLQDPTAAEDLDAVIHLAGKGIGDIRWNQAVKQEIRESRVAATEVLAKQLSQLDAPPRTFLSCSAIGYYGDRGDECVDETSSKGSGFLADVCEAWEQSTSSLLASGRTRVVHTRLGIVLHPRQGALSKLLTPIRFGVGGRMGSGRQYWSWISIADCIGALYHLLMEQQAEGVFNLVSPEPLRNSDFIQQIASILYRPAVFPAPQAALKLLLGEMAGPLLLESCRVTPAKLDRLGYSFRHSTLEVALRYLLGL